MVLCKIVCSLDAHARPKNLYGYLGVPHQAALGLHLPLAVACICLKARLVALSLSQRLAIRAEVS